ncbi:MAG: UDP-N-acetylmuramate dehydrogenase [Clostridiales bacterium]|nr:UDP-N-acetylmuramate dehydrogenase [Clostridiales bacterium]
MSFIENIDYELNFDFSRHTTYGLGGKAGIAYYPKNFEEVKAVINYLKHIKKDYVILGNGSNILASDKYFNGAVISTKNLNSIEIKNESIICGSGVKVYEFLKFCIKYGAVGYEYLAGIPATLGGITYMNGGVPRRHIGDDIVNVWIFDGKIRKLTNQNCNFGNKYSTMRDISACILQIELPFFRSESQVVRQNIKNYLLSRKNQPTGRSCGCVFKNSINYSAGKLIDECGLKGFSIGNAYVSHKHANFIINNGGSAQNVFNIISFIKRKVYEKTGILLEEEVVYIGEFDDFNG